MHGAEGGQELQTQHVVLSRTCADLYEEMVKVFANWPGIEVVVNWGSQARSSHGVSDSDDPHPNWESSTPTPA
jgi:hypothetical protein